MSPPASPLARHGKSFALHDHNFLVKANEGASKLIEQDLDIVDFEVEQTVHRSETCFSRLPPVRLGKLSENRAPNLPDKAEADDVVVIAKATHKSPSLSRSPPVRSGQFIDHRARNAIEQAEADLKAAVREGVLLETRLQKEGQASLTATIQAIEQKSLRVAELQQSIVLLDCAASKEVSPLNGFTKAQVAEVRQLARSPPEHVRRALTAIWLVLNCDRFQGKSAVQLNESRDWLLCQTMMADNSFVSRIQAFDQSSLDKAPQLLLQVARTYFDFRDSDGASHDPPVDLRKSASESSMRTSLPRRLSSLASTGLLQKTSSTLQAGLHMDGSLSTLRKIGLSTPARSRPLSTQLLNVQEVQHASEPCGILLKWLRSLVLNRARRRCLLQELAAAAKGLAAAEKAFASAERLVADIQTDISANQLQQARREQAIANIPQEVLQQPVWTSSARHALMRHYGDTANSKLASPTGNITITKTSLQKTKWWRSCERFKVPSSPSFKIHGSPSKCLAW